MCSQPWCKHHNQTNKHIHSVSMCSQPWWKHCSIFEFGVYLTTISNITLKHRKNICIFSKCSHPWCKHCFIFGCGVSLTTISNNIFKHKNTSTLLVSVHNLDANIVSSLDVESLLQHYKNITCKVSFIITSPTVSIIGCCILQN